MSEMVDRLTAIIANSDDISYEECAVLCLKALQDPTDEMMVAAEDAVPALSSFADKDKSPSYLAYVAMMDEALK